MRRDGNGSEAMALGGGRAGVRWNRRGGNGGTETETPTPTPQTKAEPLPRGSLFALLATLAVPFYPSGSGYQHPRERQYVRGAIARVRSRTCVLSIGTDANARKLRCVGSIRYL